MNKKLKIALIHRTSEQGFAMPIVIGMGLIMILVAATMIVRSQDDQVTASAQKATASSFDTTETGITRIQSLLSKYGFLATTTLSNVNTSLTTWKQVYDASPSAIAGCSGAAAGATEVSEYRVNKWVDLGSGGQFRITNYTYTPDSARITATASITLPAIVRASASLNNNISPADYLSDNSSIYGEINSVPGILSRDGNTYTFMRLSPGLDISINSSSTFTPKNTSAQLTASVTIPDKGSVNIANTNISPSDYLADSGSVKGQIQGILGILSRSGTTYKFERLYPGTGTTTTADFVPINTPGVATLTVEGRVNQSGTGNTATETTGTATSKLLINIPVKSASLNTLVAGLWVKNNRITDMDRDKINGNIVINSCPPIVGASSSNVANSSTQKVVAEPMPLPDTPDLPPSYYTLTNPWTILPRVTDLPAFDGYYHYLVDKLENPTGSSEITILPGKKVIFYVKGNINLSGNPDINKTAGNTTEQLQIYGNTYTSTTTTKYGCATGTTLGTGCPTLTAHFNGTGTMKAFVLAPDATGSVNGGGATNGNFKGALWIKDWDASSGNDKVKVDASGDYSKYLISHKLLKSPLIYPNTSWQRQER